MTDPASADVAVVPIEPTVEMVEAGRKAMSPEKFVSHARTMWVWEAMIKAAPKFASITTLQSRLALAEAERDKAAAEGVLWKESYEDVSTRASLLASMTFARNRDLCAGILAAITKADALTKDPSTAAQALLAERDGLKATITEQNKTLLEANAEFIRLRNRAESAERERDQLKAAQRTPGLTEVCKHHPRCKHEGPFDWCRIRQGIDAGVEFVCPVKMAVLAPSPGRSGRGIRWDR